MPEIVDSCSLASPAFVCRTKHLHLRCSVDFTRRAVTGIAALTVQSQEDNLRSLVRCAPSARLPPAPPREPGPRLSSARQAAHPHLRFSRSSRRSLQSPTRPGAAALQPHGRPCSRSPWCLLGFCSGSQGSPSAASTHLRAQPRVSSFCTLAPSPYSSPLLLGLQPRPPPRPQAPDFSPPWRSFLGARARILEYPGVSDPTPPSLPRRSSGSRPLARFRPSPCPLEPKPFCNSSARFLPSALPASNRCF